MTLSTNQKILTVSGRDIADAAERLRDALEPLPNARVSSLLSDIDRVMSFRGRATLVAVVDHD